MTLEVLMDDIAEYRVDCLVGKRDTRLKSK